MPWGLHICALFLSRKRRFPFLRHPQGFRRKQCVEAAGSPSGKRPLRGGGHDLVRGSGKDPRSHLRLCVTYFRSTTTGCESSSSIGFTQGSSSTSKLSNPISYKHDVFLNFRGEDTRSNFTGHLYTALRDKGIKTFIDDGLKRGEEISRALSRAINESRMSVIVFSERYAASTLCLDELVEILGCKEARGQMIRPVFYKVKPSDVRHHRGSFGKALAQHEVDFEHDVMIVRRWGAALSQAANLTGWPFKDDQNESRFIKRIVKEIADQISNSKLSLDEIRDPPAVTGQAIDVIRKPIIVEDSYWSRPAEGFLKINYDGAYTVRKGGLGVVARDTKGRFVAAKCRFVHIESEDEAVAMAALEAVCLAKELGWPRVCFEGDSVRVMSALQSSSVFDDISDDTSSFSSFSSFSSSSSSFGKIISEIQNMSRSFQQSTFSVVHRKANTVAESLATYGLSDPKDGHWLENPPSFLEAPMSNEKFATEDSD